jgi:nitrate reductase NapAB chaperone NapD
MSRNKIGCSLPNWEPAVIITGTALFIEPGSDRTVIQQLKQFPEVTFHVQSESGTELVVNLEAEDLEGLESLCSNLKRVISEIVDITHIYINFEEEIEKIECGTIEKSRLSRTRLDQ